MDPSRANALWLEPGRPGYEAWYVTVNQPSARRGFWFRYTRFQPRRGIDVEPHSAVWAFSFHRDDPSRNTAAKDVHPFSALQVARPFALSLGGGELRLDGCRGQAGDTSWELGWEPAGGQAVFPFLRPPWQGLSMVGNLGAQLQLSVSGRVTAGGREYVLINEPGGQQHTWGVSHAFSWNWGYASGDWGWVDGASSRVPSRLGRVLAGTALGASVAGEEFRLNGPLGVLRNPGVIDSQGWRVELGRVWLSIRPRREDLVGVTYDDPTVGKRFCYHTEIADLELTLGDQTIRREAAAAFEYASTQPLPDLPPKL
jgi:hypothetical protein